MRLVFVFVRLCLLSFFFFFNDTATTEIYTLSLHDALPISSTRDWRYSQIPCGTAFAHQPVQRLSLSGCFPALSDRKSTRLNSSHSQISYAVFCLKKKKKDKLELSSIKYIPHDCTLRLTCER